MRKTSIKSFLIFSFFLIFGAYVNAQTIEEARAAFVKQDFQTAFPIYLKLAEQGNSTAQIWLAIMYANGQGVSKDEAASVEWLKKSANQENPIAQNNLGQAYFYGRGVVKDEFEAARWFQKAVAQGSSAAYFNLGKMHYYGQGVNKDPVQAVKLIKTAINLPNTSKNILSTAQSELEKILKARPDLSNVTPDSIVSSSNNFTNTSNQSTTPTQTNQAHTSTSSYNQKLLRPGINQLDPRLTCLSALENDKKIQPLNGKISTTIFWDINFPMLSNQSFPTSKEQQSIAYWADELRRCISDSSAYRQKNYSRELINLLDKEDDQIQEAAIDLYNKKITYGKYNSRIQQIFKESKFSLDNIEQNKADQEAQSRARAAAMRDAQQRQEQQRMTEQRQAEQRRQAEQSRIAAVRQQWQARCELDKRNAYEQYTKSKENACNGSNKGLGVLCVVGNISAANDYADAAFNSCMSGAPIQ